MIAAPLIAAVLAASQGSAGPNRDGWIVLAVLAAIGVALLAKRRRS